MDVTRPANPTHKMGWKNENGETRLSSHANFHAGPEEQFRRHMAHRHFSHDNNKRFAGAR